MTLTDALRQTRRFWWLLVLCPLVAGSVAYLVSNASTRVYQAHSTILVEDQPSTDSSTYNDILASERRASTYSRLAESRTVLEAVIQRLNSPLAPDQLAQHVSVAPIQGTQLLTITATAADPEAAAALANAVGQVFIDQTAAQQLASGGTSRDDLQRNIDGVNQNIDTAAARIDELHAGSNVNSASIQAEIAGVQSQLNQLQTTYSTLLEARQRMDITDSQTHAQLRVAEVAAPPREPMSPHVRRSAALGGLVGLLLAAGLALAFGYLDNTVKTADDAHRLLGVTALGDLPALRGPVGLATLTGFEGTEAVRTLRTNLQFALPDRRSRSVLVTSLQPGEGKTTIIANLAVALAQTGQRVVLIDGDLRKPRLHRMFNDLSNRYGLTNLLADAGSDRLKHALQPVHGTTSIYSPPDQCRRRSRMRSTLNNCAWSLNSWRTLPTSCCSTRRRWRSATRCCWPEPWMAS